MPYVSALRRTRKNELKQRNAVGVGAPTTRKNELKQGHAVRYLATGLQTTVSSVVWSAHCPKKIFYEPTANPFESCN